ncbi:MAG: PEGA domain-containing protein [Fidelibacterota bacterium]
MLIFSILLSGITASSQDSLDVKSDTSKSAPVFPQMGYITITCDSSGLDIYIDGMLAGQAPIKEPIPLPAGKHVVTYLQPEYLQLLGYYHTGAEFQELVEKAVQTVYVVPFETNHIVLWWRPYEEKLSQRKYYFWIKSIVGVAIITLVLTLNILG